MEDWMRGILEEDGSEEIRSEEEEYSIRFNNIITPTRNTNNPRIWEEGEGE